ncbi:restriction endonuclease subunit S [Listeria welshimeri]|nr:restriction endonuclease subunit S [Listeria welshimeri]MBC2280650.1 restriction endonuclease subunit S [Listeria welshimeri]MBC2671545.1 restriction endonuclease subunit S [Listeria welshimeri]
MDTSLNKKFANVEWGKCRISDLFDIENTLSFNKDKLVAGNEYDYVTRTSLNQGVFQRTGFVNKENLNSANVWSLGLLQMDFFYRKKQWYAGQFVRKIIPKFETTERNVIFITAILNRLKPILLQVLVRNVDETFKNQNVSLPYKNGEIDFDFMDSFVAELEAERILELEAYLSATGLKDYDLTLDEQRALNDFEKLKFDKYKVVDFFNVMNTKSILSRNISKNSGKTPYLCASAENNAISSYISYDEKYMDKGNCIFIGGKTFVVTYQKDDFYSNDSHNLALYLKSEEKMNKLIQLYLATCIDKSLKHKYSWGDSISNKKIQKDDVYLPSHNGHPDYNIMETLISAIQKLVIKDVVLYSDRKVTATKTVVQQNKMKTDSGSIYYDDSIRPQVDLPMVAEGKSGYKVD